MSAAGLCNSNRTWRKVVRLLFSWQMSPSRRQPRFFLLTRDLLPRSFFYCWDRPFSRFFFRYGPHTAYVFCFSNLILDRAWLFVLAYRCLSFSFSGRHGFASFRPLQKFSNRFIALLILFGVWRASRPIWSVFPDFWKLFRNRLLTKRNL